MINNINHLGYDDLCIKVYDPTKKECIQIYKNMQVASLRLGISKSQLRTACINKVRKFSPVLDMEVAIRLAKKDPK